MLRRFIVLPLPLATAIPADIIADRLSYDTSCIIAGNALACDNPDIRRREIWALDESYRTLSAVVTFEISLTSRSA